MRLSGTADGGSTLPPKPLTDKEIEEVYSMVREGTPIYLLP